MKSMTRSIFLAFAATASVIPATVFAQDARNQGYLTDTNGNIVTSANTGMCFRDSDWTPARSVEPCDPGPRRVAEAPAPRAAAPIAPPPPAPYVAPRAAPAPAPYVAAAAPGRMSFSADALFAFDKSVLKPEGRVMLDDLTRQLSTTNYDTIRLTGHTDRLGSAAYNQKLSVRRANAVKDYLTGRNIQANRIVAEGKGETMPVTKPGECVGKKSPKLIACLQPDRRVDVEVTGTKSR